MPINDTTDARQALAALRAKLLREEQGKEFVAVVDQINAKGLPTLVPLLESMLQLKGKPFSLARHFPFEPFYKTLMPKKVVLISGRQVAKSTSLAAQGILTSNGIPYFNTLYLTPLYEMVRRFSNNYVKNFIEQSPFRKLWTTSKHSSSVLQRSFRNSSTMFFSYAFMDADRTRGINADRLSIDEVQDFDATFLPIVEETLSGSQWALHQYAGTPKTRNNTLQRLFEQSSQGEWMVPCFNCKKENYATLELDLDAMIGPWRSDISVKNPGVVCARCKFPVDPSKGRWVHRHPHLIDAFAGYHIPQIIMPMHYGDPDKWATLLMKREGKFNTGVNVFYNEVCGVAYDASSKLVSETDLRAAAMLPWKNDLNAALAQVRNYDLVILSADWGGGGTHGGKQVVSWTVYTVLGWKDGKIDVIFSHRSLTPHDQDRESRLLCELINRFKPRYFVHDFNGAGRYREQVVINAGYPLERVIPMWYVPSMSQNIIKHVPLSENNAREHFRLDKSRSLLLTCAAIRRQQIRFFEYDNYGPENPGVLEDFLALVEDKIDSRMGRDIYTIIRDQGHSDDFAHTVNMGVAFFWEHFKAWPNVAEADRYGISSELLEQLSPNNPTWADYDDDDASSWNDNY